ncbi:MAG: hypothetical protein WCG85_23920 [Polyangia bacterium]
MTEDKAAQEPDPRFLIKVVLAGMAFHLAGYAMDNAMAVETIEEKSGVSDARSTIALCRQSR